MNHHLNEISNVPVNQESIYSPEDISREEFVTPVPQQSYIWNLNVSQIRSWLTGLPPLFPTKPKPRIDIHGNVIKTHLSSDFGKC